MEKRRLRVTDGGYAVPLGNNYFLMKGRTHKQGGIGLSDKIEVENNEIVKVNKDSAKVYSAQPMIAGYSPAELILRGASPRKVFSIQQSLNGNNNDGYGREGTDFNILKNIGKLVKKIFNKTNDASGIDVNSIVVDPDELKIKQAYAESGFRSDVKSGAGASGIFQIMPDVLKDYNTANNTSFTVDDLSNDSINTVIRDFKFNKTLNSEWVNKNNPSDAVRYAKALVGYNFGNTNTLRRLERAKKDGVDIYNTLDWLSTKYLPEESVNYTKYLLGIGSDGVHRNDAAYTASKKLNKDKVEKIKQYKYDIGGKIDFNTTQLNDNTSVNYNINNKKAIPIKDADNYSDALAWVMNWLSKRYDKLDKNERNYRNDDFLFNHNFGLIDAGQRAYDRDVKRMLSTPIIIDERYKNLYENVGNINKTYSYNDFTDIKNAMESRYSYRDKKTNIDDVKASLNYIEHGHFKPYHRHIYLAPDANESTLIHEFAHTFSYPQRILISKNKKLKENIKKDDYLDSGSEIYSRLMEFRKANNINPEHKYTEEDLKELKENAKDFNLLNRYTDDTILYLLNDIAKNNNNKNKNNNVFYAKNGGQINMKLKYKNKQDITDMVMNEILYHSTGERKKFLTGGQMLGINAGLQAFNALAQGIAGSINASRIEKMYNNMTRKSTYVPIARRHINTNYDVSPMLDANRDAEFTLAKNAMANTSSSKVAREQLKQARLARLSGDNTAYATKINEENKLKEAETQLQKQYDIYDNQSLTKDISDKNDFEMQKQLGITNAKTSAANTWGQSIGNMISGVGNSLLQYTAGNYDLLKSQNSAVVAQGMQNLYGHAFKYDENSKSYVLKDAYKDNPKYQQIAAVYNNYMNL